MKLSDVMSAANLAGYAEIALVVFFVVFLLVALRVARGKKEWHRARFLPLDGDADARSEEKDDHG
jgi:hypothetical protein